MTDPTPEQDAVFAALVQDGQQYAAAHTCGNCDGIDPDTCLNNPDRPPEPDPVEEFSYKWSGTVDTINGGRTLRIPYLNLEDVEYGSVWVFGTDAPVLARMLLDTAPVPVAADGTLREAIAGAVFRHHYGYQPDDESWRGAKPDYLDLADAVIAAPEVQALIAENAELHRYHDDDRTALTEMRATVARLRGEVGDLLRQRTAKAEKLSEYIDRAVQAEGTIARLEELVPRNWEADDPHTADAHIVARIHRLLWPATTPPPAG